MVGTSIMPSKLYLFVAIDRTNKFAFVQLVKSATRVTASNPLFARATPTA
jgi:hypothetical protein